MKIFGYILNKWAIIRISIYLALFIMNALFDYYNLLVSVSLKINLILFFSLIVIEAIRIITEDVRSEKVDTKLTKIDKTTEETKEAVISIEKEVKENKPKRLEKYGKKKVDLLVELINQQVISKQAITEILNDKKFISILIYADKPKAPQKYLDLRITRKYFEMFEELGFIRLGFPSTKGYFIIAEENLYPEKLRNLDNLTFYFMDKLKISLNEEWDLVLNYSKKESTRFYTLHQGTKSSLNATILISKTNMSDMRHNFVIKNSFNKEFTRELISIANINKFKLKEKDNIEVRKFLLQSSLHILILDLKEKEKKRLLALEPRFKNELGIKKFYDYHNKNIDDITKIIDSEIKNKRKSKKYAIQIQKKSKKYKEELQELGVDLG